MIFKEKLTQSGGKRTRQIGKLFTDSSLGAVIRFLDRIGLDNVQEYEQGLYRQLIKRLSRIQNLIMYGNVHSDIRVLFVSFNLKGIPYNVLANKLGYEYGINIAYGTNGSNLYVQDLLGLSDEQGAVRE